MILTEEEARTKLCQERFNSDSGSYTCFASKCMAWRWHDEEEEIDIFRSVETDADFAKRRDLVLSRRRGYCGKPGRPSP